MKIDLENIMLTEKVKNLLKVLIDENRNSL